MTYIFLVIYFYIYLLTLWTKFKFIEEIILIILYRLEHFSDESNGEVEVAMASSDDDNKREDDCCRWHR